MFQTSKDETNKLLGGCLVGLLWDLLTMPLAMIWKGFVLMRLWGWFISPYFGLPILFLPLAIGIAIVASFATAKYTPQQKCKYQIQQDVWETIGGAASHNFVGPAFALLFGWIVQMFL